VIARIWHGWTTPENADAYEGLLRSEVLPEIRRIAGARGAYLLRSPVGDEIEFVAITLWDSLDAVQAFAGDDYELAVVPPAARRLLSRFDERSRHYEAVIDPGTEDRPSAPGD
jgi:heme-degrading monooxygenase HmoA